MPGGENGAGGPDPREARRAARQLRRERAERRYQLLEDARRERRGKVRAAVRDASRLPGLPSKRTLVVFLLLGVALTLLITFVRTTDKGPALAKSCTTPAVAVAPQNKGASTLGYSITGPATGTYIVTVDATSARVSGDTAVVEPTGAIPVSIRQGLKGCLANGTLPPLPTGRHEVVLFRDGAIVARAPVNVS